MTSLLTLLAAIATVLWFCSDSIANTIVYVWRI
jgi:hypothetical protein